MADNKMIRLPMSQVTRLEPVPDWVRYGMLLEETCWQREDWLIKQDGSMVNLDTGDVETMGDVSFDVEKIDG